MITHNDDTEMVLYKNKVVISATNVVTNELIAVIFYALISSNDDTYEIIPIERKSEIDNFLDAVVVGDSYTVAIEYTTCLKALKNVKIKQHHNDKVLIYDSLHIKYKNDDVKTYHTLDWEI